MSGLLEVPGQIGDFRTRQGLITTAPSYKPPALQAATRVGVTLKEGFEVHGDRVAFDAQSGLWTVTSAEVRSSSPTPQVETLLHAGSVTDAATFRSVPLCIEASARQIRVFSVGV